MKIIIRNIVLFLISFSSTTAYGQHLGKIDSLKKKLKEQKNDTNKVKSLYNLSFSYVAGSYPDTALAYSQQALQLAESLNYEAGIFWAEITICESLAILGNHPLSLEHSFKALALAKKLNDTLMLCYANGNLASCHYFMGDYNTSIKYALAVLKIMDSKDNFWMWIQMSKAFHSMGERDSAMLYAKKAYDRIRGMDFVYAKSVISPVLGNAYFGKANYDSALLYYRIGTALSEKSHTETHLVDNYYGIAAVHKFKGNLDSSLWYCKKIVTEKITKTYPAALLKASSLLADIYEAKKNPDSSLKYLKSAIAIRDSLSNQQKTIAVQTLIYKELEKQKELQAVKLKFRNQVKAYILIGGLIVLAVLAGVLIKNRRQKQLQKMRNSIADDLHDDIGSTLSSISIMSELAKAKSPQVSTLLASIGESTISAQENMSDIVWAIKSENDSFENVLQRMNQFSSEILDAKNVELNFESDASLSALKLSIKQRKTLYLFFKEVINNAAKHSGAKMVSVRMFRKEHSVEMIIRDNGQGFNHDQIFNGNGMNTLKRRAEELKGFFQIQSHPGKGTVVELRFKIT